MELRRRKLAPNRNRKEQSLGQAGIGPVIGPKRGGRQCCLIVQIAQWVHSPAVAHGQWVLYLSVAAEHDNRFSLNLRCSRKKFPILTRDFESDRNWRA